MDLTIPETIYAQLGGRMAATMIGMKDVLASDERTLAFRWKCHGAKNGSNKCRITLEPSDTYRVEFLSIRAGKMTVKGSFDDIYCDQLIEIFERETGLYLHF